VSKPISNPFLFVGNQIMDEYGRQIGRIASFKMAPTGRIDGVFVEHGDGEFLSYSSDQIKMNNGTLVVSPSIKLSANSLCQEIPLIWRKDRALTELVDKKKIPPEMYDDLHSTFEGALDELREKANDVINEIDSEVDRCNKQIHELHSALINLEIEREIGRLTAESYDKALKIIQWGLKGANAEKQDLELLKSKVDNLLIGEKTKPTTEEQQVKAPEPIETANPHLETNMAPNLPEPPVIIHVRNPNKQTS